MSYRFTLRSRCDDTTAANIVINICGQDVEFHSIAGKIKLRIEQYMSDMNIQGYAVVSLLIINTETNEAQCMWLAEIVIEQAKDYTIQQCEVIAQALRHSIKQIDIGNIPLATMVGRRNFCRVGEMIYYKHRDSKRANALVRLCSLLTCKPRFYNGFLERRVNWLLPKCRHAEAIFPHYVIERTTTLSPPELVTCVPVYCDEFGHPSERGFCIFRTQTVISNDMFHTMHLFLADLKHKLTQNQINSLVFRSYRAPICGFVVARYM